MVLTKSRSPENGREAIVHVGIDKTGSTTIQSTLYSVRSRLLAEERILYPSIAANHTVYLGTIFRDTPSHLLQLMEPEDVSNHSVEELREKYLRLLESELTGSGWDKVVMSAEGLCNFRPAAVDRFLNWLVRYVSDVKIVAYVRHPVTWTRSISQQRLKQGETLEQIYGSMLTPRWKERLEPWLAAVGLEKFSLVALEEARDAGGVMATFCEVAGLPYETILGFAPRVSANESMSREAVLRLDGLNRRSPLFVDGKVSAERRRGGRHDVRAIISVPGEEFRLTAEQETAARIESQEDVRWLNATFGRSLYLDVFDELVARSD